MESIKLKAVAAEPAINYSRKDFPTIDKDETLVQATRLMEKFDLDSIIVTDNKKIVGVISKAEIVDKLLVERTRRITASRMHVSSFTREIIVTAEPDITVGEACKLLVTRRVDALPIMSGNSIIGLFTINDMPRILIEVDDLPVKEVMGPAKYIARYGDRVVHVRQKFKELDIYLSPVVDFEGKLSGVVTIDEILFALLSFHERVEAKYRKERKQLLVVEDIMNRTIAILSPEDPLKTASKTIIEKRVKGGVVVDVNSIIGVVTGVEMARALASIS
jgi:predicted transcriptional regulator